MKMPAGASASGIEHKGELVCPTSHLALILPFLRHRHHSSDQSERATRSADL